MAISNRALVLGGGGLKKPNLGRDRGETFFPDSGSDLDSDETFQISRNVGLDIDEIVCLLDSQLWSQDYKTFDFGCFLETNFGKNSNLQNCI